MITGLFAIAIVIFTRGRMANLFAEFEIPLPIVSVFAFGWTIPAAMGIVLVATIVREFIGRPARAQNIWNLIAFGLIIFLVIIYVVGTFSAFLNLMDAIAR